jgi:DNA-binding NtrC family response regulator
MPLGNLLIVDDEPLLLRTLESSLEDCADRIFVAEDGQAALDLLARETIHCIICDINMPRMNGVELIKRLRATESEIPFIFYTGHGNHQLMEEAAMYGAFDFLHKPNLEGLEEVVTRGLAVGSGDGPSEATPEEDMSEYRRLLLRASEDI